MGIRRFPSGTRPGGGYLYTCAVEDDDNDDEYEDDDDDDDGDVDVGHDVEDDHMSSSK